MRSTFLLSLILCGTLGLDAQSPTPRRTTSLGIDLIVAITGLSEQTTVSPSSLEIIFKEHLEKSAIRFRGTVTTFQNERQQFAGFKVDSSFIRSYYVPDERLGIALGGEFQVTKGKNPLYAGVDVGFNYEKGFVEVDECLLEDCEQLRILNAKHHSFELTPFIGWHFDLNARFFLNLELGPYILFNYGDRSYLDEHLAVQQRSVNGSEIHMGRMLRDISIHYRF